MNKNLHAHANTYIEAIHTAQGRILQLAATAEQSSDHPIAQAILKATSKKLLVPLPLPPDCSTVSVGSGVMCTASVGEICVGKAAMYHLCLAILLQYRTHLTHHTLCNIRRTQCIHQHQSPHTMLHISYTIHHTGNRHFMRHQNITINAAVDTAMWNLEIQGKTAICIALGGEVQVRVVVYGVCVCGIDVRTGCVLCIGMGVSIFVWLSIGMCIFLHILHHITSP
ncbi:hypothetical protein EON63_04320 [archaeon]|nr:MAG: hypothetical protein EON63_04320 [archaeon]